MLRYLLLYAGLLARVGTGDPASDKSTAVSLGFLANKIDIVSMPETVIVGDPGIYDTT